MIRFAANKLLRSISVRANVTYGSDFHVGPGSVIWAPSQLSIGNDVYVGKNVTIEADGKIGDGVLIANAVGIIGRTDHDLSDLGHTIRRSRWVGDAPELSLDTMIGSDVWIGYGAVILSGVVIGESAIVAAGAVVVHDVPANTVVAGNPAKAIRTRFSPQEFDAHWIRLSSAGVRRVAE